MTPTLKLAGITTQFPAVKITTDAHLIAVDRMADGAGKLSANKSKQMF